MFGYACNETEGNPKCEYDNLLSIATIAFDTSLEDILTGLTNGIEIIFADEFALGGVLHIGIFCGNTFIYSETIPLGGDTITNDIAQVFYISEEEAERLKRQYALALKSFIDKF